MYSGPPFILLIYRKNAKGAFHLITQTLLPLSHEAAKNMPKPASKGQAVVAKLLVAVSEAMQQESFLSDL